MARRGKAGEEGSAEGGEGTGEELDKKSAEEGTAPVGYRRISSVQDAPFVTSKVGNVCSGELLNRYEMQGQTQGNRHYYQVELDKACTVTQGKGDAAEEIEVPAGTVVNLGENMQIGKSLKPVVIPEINANAAYKIHVLFKKKIKISGAKNLWIIDIFAKRTRGPVGAVTALPPDNGGDAEAEGESAF